MRLEKALIAGVSGLERDLALEDSEKGWTGSCEKGRSG